MSNVIQFRSRAQLLALVPLVRLSLSRAKAFGVCPEPANDTTAIAK